MNRWFFGEIHLHAELANYGYISFVNIYRVKFTKKRGIILLSVNTFIVCNMWGVEES
jgi:hypothetical protein